MRRRRSTLGRKLKLIFYWLIGTIFALLLVITLALVWAVKNPREAFSLAERYLLPKDLSIKWEEMNFGVQRASWHHWEIKWNTRELHIRKGEPEINFPVTEASTAFTFRFFEPGPTFHFESVKMRVADSARFKSGPDSEEPSEQQSPFEMLNTYLGYLETATDWVSLDNLLLEIPRFELAGQEGPPSILQVHLTKPVGEEGSRATGFKFVFEAGANKIDADGWLDALRLGNESPFLALTINAKGKGWGAKTEITGRYHNEQALFDGHSAVEYGEGKKVIKAQPKFTLTLNEAEGVFRLESAVKDIPGPLVKLDKLQAEVRLPFDAGFTWSERPATFKIWSPVELFFIDKDMRPPLEKSCQCKIPETLVFTYEGRAWPGIALSQPQQPTVALESKLGLESVDNKLLTVHMAAHLRAQKHAEKWILDPRLDSELTINSYQGLRKFLDARNVLIPSPVDVLDGKIHVSAKSPVEQHPKMIKSAVDINIDLSSPSQRVLVDSIIRLELARDFKSLDVFIQAVLKDIRLELPPIDPVRGLPPLVTDKRMIFKKERPPRKSNFKARVFFDVQTVSPGALKLLSNLAEPYGPVTIKVNNTNQGESAGFVRLEPFAIEYLRRRVNVERLQVVLAEDEDGDFPISGRIRLDQTNYKIYVDIAGTLDAPIINLNSEPFLPRSDIISVLLFDRVSDQLVTADADTAGSFEAALADRAIGLFGLWAFASTPIRSFSYNAVTKVYTATVQLADGLTAGVGTNWERAAHLEVRKRVSRRWVLTASWSPDKEQAEQVGKLVLQWEKRF